MADGDDLEDCLLFEITTEKAIIDETAKLVLCIAYSNAGEERVFSMVRKNKTPFRPNLALDKTLPSLLTVNWPQKSLVINIILLLLLLKEQEK